MKRRGAYFLVAFGAMVGLAAIAQRPQGNLLILDWCAKAAPETPPVAVLIEMGTKDTEPTDWSGRAAVTGAKVVHREGYRFHKDDKLTAPDGWSAKSHRPIRVPRGQPAVARQEGIVTVGVVLHLADVQPDAALRLETAAKNAPTADVPLKSIVAGKAEHPANGVTIRRLSTTSAIASGKTEDDFPAAAYGPDGTLWAAFISYHLKDENRRIEQHPLREQPANFKDFYTPEFGDQLFVKYYRQGKWSEPMAVTEANEDLARCAIAVDRSGAVVVAYSANRRGHYDLYARTVSPIKGREWRISSDESAGCLSPVMCTGQWGNILLAAQAWSKDGAAGVFCLRNLVLMETAWNAQQFGGAIDGNWNLCIAAGPNNQWHIASDRHLGGGDYDVVFPYHGDRRSIESGDQSSVASSSRFEARPSLSYDAAGRLWIAYEEGPERWGQDYGALAAKDGQPLYSSRTVRVVCLADGKLMRPAAELPASEVEAPRIPYQNQAPLRFERQPRYSGPKIGIDGKGRIWLTYRQKFGTRHSTQAGSYWLTFARRLEGDKWSEPIELHHSDGLLDHRPVLLPHASGGLLVIHNGDCRYTEPETIHNHVYASIIDLPGETPEPKLVPHEPGQKNPPIVAEARAEAENVQRIRGYRIENAGKKYQLLRGEFHRHTELSWDGGPDGSLEDMFRYAIDAAALDWIGNGDHDNGAGREYSWWLVQKFTDAYHVKDHFTPMFTYERSVAYPHGHRNCMFAQRGVRTLPRLAEPDMQKRVGGIHADDTKMLYRYLHELNGICASHTSATGMGTDWRDNDPQVEPVVEIYQGDRMSYEYEGAPRAGHDPKSNKLPAQIGGWQPAGFLNHAFDKGYRIGFQSSSDHWSTHISYCIVAAERHDRQAILDGLKKRHCYGATDNIIVDIRSGEHMMGDEFKTSDPPSLEMTVIGPDTIEAIDILRDSKVVESIRPQHKEYRGKWADPHPASGMHYYYVRVTQKNGELAWASPMWIDYGK